MLRRLLIGKLSIRRLIGSIVFTYGCLALYAYWFSDSLIFLPPRPTYADGHDVIKIPIPKAGTTISAYYLPNPAARFVLLYSHGNGNDLGEVRFHLEELRSRGYGVFAYDYEGYGTSSGSPSEAAVYRDVDAAYSYLTSRLGISASRIVPYGFSLGGAAALDLAVHRAVAGVVLESTFVTAFRVRTHFALVPFDEFDNLLKIEDLRRPLLLMHSRDDPLIAFWQAETLFGAASEPKTLVAFDSGHHGGAAWSEPKRYWGALTAFTDSLHAAS